MQRKRYQSSCPICCKENKLNIRIYRARSIGAFCKRENVIYTYSGCSYSSSPLRVEGLFQPTGWLCEVINYYGLWFVVCTWRHKYRGMKTSRQLKGFSRSKQVILSVRPSIQPFSSTSGVADNHSHSHLWPIQTHQCLDCGRKPSMWKNPHGENMQNPYRTTYLF